MGIGSDEAEIQEYLVCYDLRNNLGEEEPNYVKLKEKLESFPYSCRIQKSVWVIGGNYTRVEIMTIVHKVMDESDSLFVANYTSSSNHHGDSDLEYCYGKRSNVTELTAELNEWGKEL